MEDCVVDDWPRGWTPATPPTSRITTLYILDDYQWIALHIFASKSYQITHSPLSLSHIIAYASSIRYEIFSGGLFFFRILIFSPFLLQSTECQQTTAFDRRFGMIRIKIMAGSLLTEQFFQM